MRTTLRILSYYTLVVLILTVVMPLLNPGSVGDESVTWPLILIILACIPVVALVVMVLGETGGRVRRTALCICAGYTAIVLLVYVGLQFKPPIDPSAVISALIYIPVVIFAALVLVALKKRIA